MFGNGKTSNNNLQEFINRHDQSQHSDEKLLGIYWSENADGFLINL